MTTMLMATMTLEQALERAWEELRAHGEADCPLCHESMAVSSSGAGECTGCGSQLS